MKRHIATMAVLPNGILAIAVNNYIQLWNTYNGSLIRILECHGTKNVVYALGVLPNGYLASGSCDNTIKIWDISNGSLVRTLDGHTSTVYSLAVLSNGHLASSSGCNDKTIKIWDTLNGSLIRTFEAQQKYFGLAALLNGNLASGSQDHTIKIWDTSCGALIRTLETYDPVNVLAVLPNGHLASGHNVGYIKIWDTSDGSLINTLEKHCDHVISLAVLSNGLLASGGCIDFKIKIWDTSNCSLIRTFDMNRKIDKLVALPSGDLASSNNIKLYCTPTISIFDCIEIISGSEISSSRISLEDRSAKRPRLETDSKEKVDAKETTFGERMMLSKCSICLESINESTRKIVMTNCGHFFCKNCLDSHIHSGAKSCPNCKYEFRENFYNVAFP